MFSYSYSAEDGGFIWKKRNVCLSCDRRAYNFQYSRVEFNYR